MEIPFAVVMVGLSAPNSPRPCSALAITPTISRSRRLLEKSSERRWRRFAEPVGPLPQEARRIGMFRPVVSLASAVRHARLGGLEGQ